MTGLVEARQKAIAFYEGRWRPAYIAGPSAIFPGDPPQYVTPTDHLPCDAELSQEIEKKLPTDPDEIERIWKAVQDIARG